MKFYDCKTAPSPRRVRIFAAEKGITLDAVEVDLAHREQFSDEFRRINPDCVVPVLELDSGERLTEVLPICQYLEEIQPQPVLIGATALQRATTTMWATKAEQQGLAAVRDVFRNTAKGLRNHALTGPEPFKQIPELAERGRKQLAGFLARLNEQLAEREFVAGDFYSIADITALVCVDFSAWTKFDIPENAVHLKRWHSTVSSRPSAAA